jgi:monofunctional biosynthetic peptidoglycan transglycosylase
MNDGSENRPDGPPAPAFATATPLPAYAGEPAAAETIEPVAVSSPGPVATAAPRWKRYAVLAAKIALVIVALPLVLTPIYWIVPPISTLMLWSAITFQGMDRDWVSFDDISPNVVNAVAMSEDGQFCAHNGVDWNQLESVLSREGGPSRGASTIPMQTVKNLYLWPSRSYLRKGLEIPLALYADFIWSKRRLMEIYLNIAQWGPGLFGVEAAAQRYFKKPAKNLTAREGALLAAALPNPILRNPGKPSRALQAHARIIQRRAAQAGPYVDCM